eukprot:11993436-Ditylum_brightwellii.AAC.1
MSWKIENIKQNWIQNEEIGSHILRKPVNHTRIHMINPDGISLANNGLEFKMLCKESMANRTDYMGYMETNLDTMCGSITKAIHENARK